MRLLLLGWLLLAPGLWTQTTWASSSVLVNGTSDAPSVSATEYHSLGGATGMSWQSTESFTEGYAASAGTFSSLYVELSTDPDNGAGVDSYVFTVRQNGTTNSDITCTIADGATTCTNTGNTLVVSAGDRVAISCVPSGTPAASTNNRWSIKFNGSTAAESLLLGTNGANTSATNDVDYPAMGFVTASETAIADVMQEVPMAGTIKNLYIRAGTAPGGSVTYTYALYVNSLVSSVTCGITGTATTCSDLSNTASVTAGNEISLKRTDNGTPSATGQVWGLTMLATTDGQFMVPFKAADALSTTATEYNYAVAGNGGTWGATESAVFSLGQSMTIQALYAELGAAITSGSYAFTLREEAADTAAPITCTITGTTCSQTSQSEAIGDGATLGWVSVPSSPSNARQQRMSVQGFLTPTAAARRVLLISQEDRCAVFFPRSLCPSRN